MQNKKHYRLILTVSAMIFLLISGGLIINKLSYVFAQNQNLAARTCVVIDAGHGGIDGGAISCSGAIESQINLEIALRLNDMLQLLGIQTKMIRTEDISVYTSGETIAAKKISDLKERVKFVNTTPNAILISIHQNYFSDSKYSGAQVFYTDNNSTLAKLLQENFIKILNKSSRRKAKQGEGIYLLKHINCTAALIECGFLSNPQEEQKLRTDEYQKRISCIISSTLSCYIQKASVA